MAVGSGGALDYLFRRLPRARLRRQAEGDDEDEDMSVLLWVSAL